MNEFILHELIKFQSKMLTIVYKNKLNRLDTVNGLEILIFCERNYELNVMRNIYKL